ncbi:MAG: hypothetical protein WBB74_00900 [Gaiellaceae bacterium]
MPIYEAMDHARFPWRPLGTLLVDDGLLTADQLEQALAEQRKTGRLLGEIVVAWGYVTGISLALALAKQHGVELEPRGGSDPPDQEPASTGAKAIRGWRPLGKVLVEGGYVSEAELDQALVEQREDGGRLGEILVERGYVSGPALARALAEQHGVDLGTEGTLDESLRTTLNPSAPGEPVYRVCASVFEPSYRTGSALYESGNFLEAADFAFEFVDDHEPAALEIQRLDGETRETVWMYSESRAAAEAASRKSLTETFGFDPLKWGAGRRFNP